MIAETVPICTYITPYDTSIPDVLRKFLDSARVSIRVIIYGATLPSLFDGMVAAHQRGVDVRAIFDHSQATGHAESQMLHALFLQIPPAQFRIGTSPMSHQIVHLKASWIDSARVWSGSWNYSTSATSQVNNIDVIESTARAAAFDDAFSKLWAYIDTNEKAYQLSA